MKKKHSIPLNSRRFILFLQRKRQQSSRRIVCANRDQQRYHNRAIGLWKSARNRGQFRDTGRGEKWIHHQWKLEKQTFLWWFEISPCHCRIHDSNRGSVGNGFWDTGYKFKDEITDMRFDKGGVLAMANGGPATNSSQFFITHLETPWLDGKHTIFGQCCSKRAWKWSTKWCKTIS